MKRSAHVVLSHNEWEKFREFIKSNGITYEPSGYGKNVYIALEFETENQYTMTEQFLETL